MAQMPNGLMLVVTTSDDRAVLEKIAGRLVELRLAACCQISSPITSVYRWEGSVEQSEEFECRIKTTEAHFEALVTAIESLHNYDVPQIVGVPIEACSESYRAWLLTAVSQEN
jgi:periplasmic divalent cation tolerance protein